MVDRRGNAGSKMVQKRNGEQRFERRHGTRRVHHNPTTTAWRLTAFGGGLRLTVTSENRSDSAHGALWR
jgi:hypothetical protein